MKSNLTENDLKKLGYYDKSQLIEFVEKGNSEEIDSLLRKLRTNEEWLRTCTTEQMAMCLREWYKRGVEDARYKAYPDVSIKWLTEYLKRLHKE